MLTLSRDMTQDERYLHAEKMSSVFDTPLPNLFALQGFSYQRVAQHDAESHETSKTQQISFSRDISK
jgi:hypothetical protein